MEPFRQYVADAARYSGGERIAFYTHHITVASLRGERQMRFCDVVTCVETYAGFALYDESNWIILRAQDLTAADLQFVREYLAERLDPKVMECRSRAMYALGQPLPIPPLYSESVCLTTAEIAFEQTEWYKKDASRRFYLLLTCVLSLALLVGVMLAAVLMITEQYLLDLLIFCAAWLAGGVVVTWLLTALFRRKNRDILRLQFEPDGLRLTVGHKTCFIIKERVWLTVGEDTVHLRFRTGDTLSIPLSAVQDVNVLKALAGIA